MFRTELTIAPAAGQLARTARVLTMGSCFADTIGARLQSHKVETRVNPFGTVFQPLALARLLRAAAGEDVDWQQHLVEARGRWQSYDLHGSIGADSPVELLQHLQQLVHETGEFLRQADVVLLTLGTAWAYRLRETGELVSNCHKQPADLFVRELLTPDEIINALAETHAYLRRINPRLRFVLTVSPVRHVKDTLQLNSVSKSVLRLATHVVSELLPDVAYFPAYELLMDDLRDYRFYAADMLHPSEVAEDYVWEKFARTYFDADFGRFRKEWAAVQQALQHRPLHAAAPEHRQFLEKTREKLEQLSLRQVNVAAELDTVQAQLAALPAAPVSPEPATETATLENTPMRAELDQPVEAAAPVGEAPAPASGRAPRLTPEEFRAQRAARPERERRDGRGKSRPAPLAETERYQTADFAEADALLTPLATDAVALSNTLPDASAAVPAGELDANQLEPARKKKRRSRGGAKRTARKHALRLAAEMGISESQLPTAATAPETAAAALNEPAATPPAKPKSSVIVKSQPVKRGGGRTAAGRGARVELYTTPPPAVPPAAPAAMPEAVPVDAELPVLPSEAPAVEVAAVLQDAATPDALGGEAQETLARNSRSRRKKKPAQQEAGPAETLAASAGPEAPAAGVPAGTGEQPAGFSGPEIPLPERRQPALPVAALPVEGPAAATAAEAVGPPVPKAQSARRAKSRALSGARLEKPAVDMPIIPVEAGAERPAQVAAGRMKGSTAELLTPTKRAKSNLKKADTPAKTAGATPTPDPAASAGAAAPKTKASTAKKKPAPEPAPVPAVSGEETPTPPEAAPKPKTPKGPKQPAPAPPASARKPRKAAAPAEPEATSPDSPPATAKAKPAAARAKATAAKPAAKAAKAPAAKGAATPKTPKKAAS